MNGADGSLESRLAGIAAAGHRALVVLAGDRDAGLAFAGRLFAGLEGGETLSLSDHPHVPAPVLDAPKPAQLVGLELDAVLVDAHAGFDADTFGAVAGTVRGGGMLVLCCPRLDVWAAFDDPCRTRFSVFGSDDADIGRRYLDRLARRLAGSEAAIVLDPAVASPPPLRARTPARAASAPGPAQAAAVEAVRHVVSGQRRRPVVLTADRGRGKSAALGLAAAALLRDGARRVVVSAASRAAVGILFRHARAALGDEVTGDLVLRRGESVIEYLEPARLLTLEAADLDLVLIDEAAALPLHWLERVLRRFGRVAFATTVHGYEGSGRGFATRFDELLARHTRGWRRLELVDPVRYAADDPVERLVFDILMLDAEPASLAPGGVPDNVRVVTLERGRLVEDEGRLREFFGLLVAAHYRTRPNDLRYLLDGPNLRLVAALQGDAVVGAMVLAREGGFEPATAERIRAGRARPRGHMLAETVCAQLGDAGWLAFGGLRVVRIAVHPDRRRRGIGTRMLAHAASMAAADGCRYIGSSFAVGRDIARFWIAAGYRPLWLSGRRNAASGARSLLVARTLDEDAARVARRARRRFLDGFALRLAGLYVDEEPDHVAIVFHDCPDVPAPGQADIANAARFARGESNFEAAFTGLWRLAMAVLARPALAGELSAQDRALMVRLVLQQKDPGVVGREFGLQGRRAALLRLAVVFACVCEILSADGGEVE